jgi:PRTRC genetic system protein B
MQIRDHENKPFIPTHFLTVYSQGGNDYSNKYLEVGEIQHIDGKYKIGVSQPADKEFLNELVSTIKVANFKALRFKGLVPENVWYYHSEDAEPTIIWTHKKCSKQLHFLKSMGIESGIYKLPNILFATHKDELYCFRLDNGNTIEKSLELDIHMMPLPNIYDDSKVCLGGNKLKKAKTLDEYIHNMEELFFKTRFNALHHEGFGKDTIVIDVMKYKDINRFHYVSAKQKTLKKLLDEIS